MNISRYTYPVIIAAGLHGALLLNFTDAAVVVPPDKATPVWNPPIHTPVEVILTEPEEGATGAKWVGVAPMITLPEIPRPLPDNTVITMTTVEHSSPLPPVNDLRTHRGDFIGRVMGTAGDFLPNSIPNAMHLDRVPRAIVQPAPDYPDSLRRDQINGSVTVEFLVDTAGRVVKAEAIRWTHREFVESAVRGVLRWKFEPGTLNSVKVRFRMAVPIEFNSGT